MAQQSFAQRLVTVAVTMALTIVGATVLLLVHGARNAEAATELGAQASRPAQVAQH